MSFFICELDSVKQTLLDLYPKFDLDIRMDITGTALEKIGISYIDVRRPGVWDHVITIDYDHGRNVYSISSNPNTQGDMSFGMSAADIPELTFDQLMVELKSLIESGEKVDPIWLPTVVL